MLHQERWRAVGTHYAPTRIYGPTGHAIGGMAQLAIRSSSTAAIIAGPRQKERKDIASFYIANGGKRRHVMCVGARSGSNPGPLGSEPSALTSCSSCLLDSKDFEKLVPVVLLVNPAIPTQWDAGVAAP